MRLSVQAERAGLVDLLKVSVFPIPEIRVTRKCSIGRFICPARESGDFFRLKTRKDRCVMDCEPGFAVLFFGKFEHMKANSDIYKTG